MRNAAVRFSVSRWLVAQTTPRDHGEEFWCSYAPPVDRLKREHTGSCEPVESVHVCQQDHLIPICRSNANPLESLQRRRFASRDVLMDRIPIPAYEACVSSTADRNAAHAVRDWHPDRVGASSRRLTLRA